MLKNIYLVDSFIFSTNNASPMISVFDKSGTLLTSFLHQGRSGTEVLAGQTLTVEKQNRRLTFWDPMQGRMVIYGMDDIFDADGAVGSRYPRSQIIDVGAQRYFSHEAILFQNRLVTLSPRDLTVFVEYDPNGTYLGEKGISPNDSELKDLFKPLAYKASMVAREDNSAIAVCYHSTDVIDIFDADYRLKVRLHGPDVFPAYFTPFSGDGVSQTRPIKGKTRFAFSHCVSEEEKLWVLYNGHLVEPDAPYAKNILCFDWDGNPIANYELDCEIISFDVDAVEKKIYVLTYDLYGTEIYTFDIS
jgi:hypothetical protein